MPTMADLAAPEGIGAALMVTGTYWGRSIEHTHRTRMTKESTPCPTTTPTTV
ncbi:hypothetical protein [Streptomyces smyrnaeus]|uniref:hypothetical protein n=1 Tax=Streptomyces smyrnaeus TaxID=1387713 RepID=UPI0036CD878D